MTCFIHRILRKLQSFCFKVDRKWDVTYGAVRVAASGRFTVLFYTFAVENVVALGFDCVLGDVVAEPADGCFHDVGGEVRVGLALEDEIGMARLRPR